MITVAEADMTAAALVLVTVQQMTRERLLEVIQPDDVPAVQVSLAVIEHWLRRRAVGGDKILLRQMERPTARQVKPTGRAARAIEAAARARGKP